jgi:hypothetical protein
MMSEIAPMTPMRRWAEASAVHSLTRRRFVEGVLGGAALAAMPRRLVAQALEPGRKLIVVTFGGGARDDETFSLLGQQNIPHLVGSLAPQGTFFPQVVNRGILGHYVATASIATGTYQTFDNFVVQQPAAPTMFEYYRKGLARPASDAWVIAPSNGFDQLGSSSHSAYGANYGAEIVLPKRLLALAAGAQNHTLRDYESLLHDNYETPIDRGAEPSGPGQRTEADDRELERMAGLLQLSLAQFTQHARSLQSPDELSLFIARQAMQQVAPSLMFLTLHDMDVAHSGAFSLYIDAIQRADRLVAELWQAIQTNPEYAGRTTLLLLPDFGRDADGEASGFQHHRTGSAMARTTWMLALGRGVPQGRIVRRPLESVDIVPTAGKLLGFATPFCSGHPIVELG